MIDFLDVQKETPKIKVGIEKVGVKKINFPLKKGDDFAFLTINLFVNIPPERKGADMSRAVESIQKVLNNMSPTDKIGDIGLEICEEALLRFNYSERAHCKIDIRYYKKDKEGYLEYQMYVNTIRSRKEILKNEIGISYVSMTACPCAMETTRTLISIENPNLTEALSSIPTITHNQRNITKIIVDNRSGRVDMWDIAGVIEKVQGKPLDSLLKRVEEGNLVYRAHKNPKFVEDVVREIAYQAARDLPLPDEAEIRVSSESDESIHPHNAYAEIQITAGDLRKISGLIDPN
ncbi:GTP cyclohydrolase MptA [Thermoplasma sp.]|uniref:GTP cyclohydrolase MptA n=1 Tax=Thermoplasma sp. TaxID=1973142 RepID=UPI001288B7B6|nr:GTP cyclohydrolase MptA [Thermoplasma sp.]KAA8922283.1 MAG: GTP cyclohydrolase I FolE2 [Thermoplasma sp.]